MRTCSIVFYASSFYLSFVHSWLISRTFDTLGRRTFSFDAWQDGRWCLKFKIKNQPAGFLSSRAEWDLSTRKDFTNPVGRRHLFMHFSFCLSESCHVTPFCLAEKSISLELKRTAVAYLAIWFWWRGNAPRWHFKHSPLLITLAVNNREGSALFLNTKWPATMSEGYLLI